MGTFTVGEVVIVRFPYSDLKNSKIRPALIIGIAEFNNYIVCQITSSPFSSKIALEISDADITGAGLHKEKSFVRPDKIFTADPSIIVGSLGKLNIETKAKVDSRLSKILRLK